MKKVLTIAGSDCSGGAGVQADIKTITVHGMYAMSAITTLTAQNTTGVASIYDVSARFIGQQLDCIFNDIYPDAVKIGMVSNVFAIDMIVQKLKEYRPPNIVIDPVMMSSTGHSLINDSAKEALVTKLLPLGNIITPNIPEASVIAEMDINNDNDMIYAAKKIHNLTSADVLIKGGHSDTNANDLLVTSEGTYWFRSPKILNPNTHGTGCTLSSAIACELASGKDIGSSIKSAKAYITNALKANLNLGHGNGPLNHMV